MSTKVLIYLFKSEINNGKPDAKSVPIRMLKICYKEFGKLVISRVVHYRHICKARKDNYQLVLPKQFHSAALRDVHNDISFLVVTETLIHLGIDTIGLG